MGAELAKSPRDTEGKGQAYCWWGGGILDTKNKLQRVHTYAMQEGASALPLDLALGLCHHPLQNSVAPHGTSWYSPQFCGSQLWAELE